ncbi:MAG TPA: hypothetical protein DDY13_07435 [Cytophagales bacterium]|jgi:uncharacterized protein (DUF1800 family)|nr:hypothetical protein [Cytophagales bacterium]
MADQLKSFQDQIRNYQKEKLEELRRCKKIVFERPIDTSGKKTGHPARSTTKGLEPYTGLWDEPQAAHLLKRTLFGVKQSELSHFTSIPLNEAVNEILDQEEAIAPPVNNYNELIESPDPDVPAGGTWTTAPYNLDIEYARLISLKGWIINNMMTQKASIHHKLTLFWHNLLPTQFIDLFIAKMSYQYYNMLHTHALGNYKTIIRELTTNPAMLFFLNGIYNVKEAPDENYARELQELFTLGKGPGSNYTEGDVYEAARVLTGWTVDWQTVENEGEPQYVFNQYGHDTDDKQFSAFYNNRVISGRSGQDGKNETGELLEMIFENEETARYICRRIYNFFVYHEVDDNAELNVIRPMAEIFRTNNYEIKPVLKALLKSAHFYESANLGAYIKSPLDHVLSLLRVFDIAFPADYTAQYQFGENVYWQLAILGQEIGDPPSVAGWQAYHQQPTFDKIWINTDTATKRAQLQDYLVYHLVDLPAFISKLQNPGNVYDLINDCSGLFLGIEINEEVVNALKDTLLSGQQSEAYWTYAWDNYINEPENDEYRSTVENRLKAMFQQFLQLSEFQLM